MSGKKHYYEVFGLIYHRSPGALSVCQPQSHHPYLEYLVLHRLPLPTLLPLTRIELDFLHTAHKLHKIGLISSKLLKPHIVEASATLEKGADPPHICRAANHEHTKYAAATSYYHHCIYRECHHRQHRAYQGACEKTFYPAEILYPLQDITDVL